MFKEDYESGSGKHFRHELKYVIPYADYLAMRARLRKVMSKDPHIGEAGTHQIRSIYFDNSDDKALREKINGISKREKFRIRYYNDDFSFITLEKKMKIDSLCLKQEANPRLQMQQTEPTIPTARCRTALPQTTCRKDLT